MSFSFSEEEKILSGRVSDTGIGIKNEDHDKLFKLFGKIESG